MSAPPPSPRRRPVARGTDDDRIRQGLLGIGVVVLATAGLAASALLLAVVVGLAW